MNNPNQNLFSTFKSDLPASFVVFLVALPLCLGISLASGAPLFSGIISGIIGGIVVGAISGSQIGVSGPAAGLAVIVFHGITDLATVHGPIVGFQVFLSAVVIAGVLQIILGILKAGVIGYYFPSSVIKGMLAGIGVTIFMKEIPHALGADGDAFGDDSFFQMDVRTKLSEMVYMFEELNTGAIIVSCLSLLVLILWERPFMKKLSFTTYVQGPLVAVFLGIVLNLAFVGTSIEITKEHLVDIPVAENFNDFLGLFTLPDFSFILDTDLLMLAGTMAVVASLETLLCVEATDKLDPYKRVTPTNKELIAQGTGNVLAGLIGGLPITQVIVRSSANIQSGGKSKLSAIIHGVILLICAISIPDILNKIPYASLAAILLVVGFKLAKPSLFKEMYSYGWGQFTPFILTVLVIYFSNLLVGIGVGLAIAVVQILWVNFNTPYHIHADDLQQGKPIHIKFSENVSFLNKASILNTLNTVPDNTKVILDASACKNIHHDVLEIIENFEQNANFRGIIVEEINFENVGHYDSVGTLNDHLERRS